MGWDRGREREEKEKLWDMKRRCIMGDRRDGKGKGKGREGKNYGK